MKKRFTFLLIMTLMSLVMFSAMEAQTKLVKSVIGSGGVVGEKNSNGMVMNSVTGQFVIESIKTNTPGSQNYVLNQGFWIPEAREAVGVEEDPTVNSNLLNYPNPFSSTTTIEYELPGSANVSLKIYDMSGNEIKSVFDGYQSNGIQRLTWDAKDNFGVEVNSGSYLYELHVKSSEIAGASKNYTLKNIMIIVK